MSDVAANTSERLASVDMPRRIAVLPRDERGYPIPKFVEVINGEPDFRIMSQFHMTSCIKRKLCWICGQGMGRHLAFVIGPMCIIERLSSEPPSHLECAEYAVKVCPFLALPHMRRIESNLPEGAAMAGFALARNPGVAGIWNTKSYELMMVGKPMFIMGKPDSITWWAHGRTATRAEVVASIDSGYPLIMKEAIKRNLVKQTEARYAAALKLLPAE